MPDRKKKHRPRSIGENPTHRPAVFRDATFKNFMAIVFRIKLDRKKKTNLILLFFPCGEIDIQLALYMENMLLIYKKAAGGAQCQEQDQSASNLQVPFDVSSFGTFLCIMTLSSSCIMFDGSSQLGYNEWPKKFSPAIDNTYSPITFIKSLSFYIFGSTGLYNNPTLLTMLPYTTVALKNLSPWASQVNQPPNQQMPKQKLDCMT